MLDHRGVDLEALIGRSTDLRKAGRTLRGRCPIHQGDNPQSLTVFQGREGAAWRCQACGAGGDGIAWLQALEGLSFAEAKAALALPDDRPAEPRPIRPPEGVNPPPEAWQQQARAFVADAQARLWAPEGASALAWLRGRGFADATLRDAGLGFNPADAWHAGEDWGLPDKPKLWTPRGVVTPWAVDGQLWRVSIRTPEHSPPWDKSGKWAKHYQISGSKSAPLGIDLIQAGKPVVIVEAAFNALAIKQEAGDLITPVAVGGKSSCRRVRWAMRLSRASVVLLSFDADLAGEEAADYWRGVLPAFAWRPTFDDPAAMLAASPGSVRDWVLAGLAASGFAAMPLEPSQSPVATPEAPPATMGGALEDPSLECDAPEAPESPTLAGDALEGPALEGPTLEGPTLEGASLECDARPEAPAPDPATLEGFALPPGFVVVSEPGRVWLTAPTTEGFISRYCRTTEEAITVVQAWQAGLPCAPEPEPPPEAPEAPPIPLPLIASLEDVCEVIALPLGAADKAREARLSAAPAPSAPPASRIVDQIRQACALRQWHKASCYAANIPTDHPYREAAYAFIERRKAADLAAVTAAWQIEAAARAAMLAEEEGAHATI